MSAWKLHCAGIGMSRMVRICDRTVVYTLLNVVVRPKRNKCMRFCVEGTDNKLCWSVEDQADIHTVDTHRLTTQVSVDDRGQTNDRTA